MTAELSCLFAAVFSFPSLPPAEYDDTEVVTNGVISEFSDLASNPPQFAYSPDWNMVFVVVRGFTGDVYTNDTETALVSPTFEVPVRTMTRVEIPLHFNPYMSSSRLGPSVTETWIPDGGDEQTRAAQTLAFL